MKARKPGEPMRFRDAIVELGPCADGLARFDATSVGKPTAKAQWEAVDNWSDMLWLVQTATRHGHYWPERWPDAGRAWAVAATKGSGVGLIAALRSIPWPELERAIYLAAGGVL